jgi:hypothetical protein
LKEYFAWWLTSVIPVLGNQTKEDYEFKASLGYIVRACLKRKKGRKGGERGHNEEEVESDWMSALETSMSGGF